MRSRLLTAAALVLLVLLAVGVWVAVRAWDGAHLGRRPEAGLRYPSSEVLAQGDVDRVQDFLGTTDAAWWMILGNEASTEQVESFYRKELAAMGWGDSRMASRTTTELSAVDWRYCAMRFRLSFMDTEEWYQRIEGSDRFPTLYEIRIIDTDWIASVVGCAGFSAETWDPRPPFGSTSARKAP